MTEWRYTTKRAELACPNCQSDDTWCLEAMAASSRPASFLKCKACEHMWSIPRVSAEPPCDYPKQAYTTSPRDVVIGSARLDGYRAAITSLEFMSMVMVHPEVAPRNSNGAGLGPRR